MPMGWVVATFLFTGSTLNLFSYWPVEDQVECEKVAATQDLLFPDRATVCLLLPIQAESSTEGEP